PRLLTRATTITGITAPKITDTTRETHDEITPRREPPRPPRQTNRGVTERAAAASRPALMRPRLSGRSAMANQILGRIRATVGVSDGTGSSGGVECSKTDAAKKPRVSPPGSASQPPHRAAERA